MAASATAAQAADVYGQVRVSVDMINSDTANNDRTQVSSQTSRIGVKGTEDLGGGMSAIYGLEWGVSFANNGSGTTAAALSEAANSSMSARNQFVGLKGAFGTVLVGRHDAPYKLAGSADLFADTTGDATCETATASATGVCIIGRNGFDTRAQNTVAYVSPDWNGFHFAVAGIPGEQTGASEANGLADAWSATAVYKNGPLNASVSQQKFSKEFPATNGAEDKTGTKFNIGYTMGDIKLGYTHESSDNGYTAGSQKDKGQLASIAYGMGPITLGYQYGYFNNKNTESSTQTDVKTHTVGVIYALSKRTSTYAAYADVKNTHADTADGKVFTMGLNHAF